MTTTTTTTATCMTVLIRKGWGVTMTLCCVTLASSPHPEPRLINMRTHSTASSVLTYYYKYAPPAPGLLRIMLGSSVRTARPYNRGHPVCACARPCVLVRACVHTTPTTTTSVGFRCENGARWHSSPSTTRTWPLSPKPTARSHTALQSPSLNPSITFVTHINTIFENSCANILCLFLNNLCFSWLTWLSLCRLHKLLYATLVLCLVGFNNES